MDIAAFILWTSPVWMAVALGVYVVVVQLSAPRIMQVDDPARDAVGDASTLGREIK